MAAAHGICRYRFSGFKAAIIAYKYDIMPDRDRTVYECWFIALQGASSFIAPFAGNVLLKRLPVINNTIFEYSNYQLALLLFCTHPTFSILLI